MGKEKEIKYLLFDLAGVILNLDIEADTKALNAVGLPNFAECQKIPELMRPVWDYLNGLSQLEEFMPQIRPFCKPEATDEEILWSMDAVLGDIPAHRLQLLADLRKKYKVYLLSNLNKKDWEYTQGLIDQAGWKVEELFDQTFISYQMKLAKPDHRIFQQVIDQTGLNPAETLYLDDTNVNIVAGREMGFQAQLVPMNQIEELLPDLHLLD